MINTKFKNKAFDICFCRNTLHHLKKEELLPALKEMDRIAKKIVLVEIEDPKE